MFFDFLLLQLSQTSVFPGRPVMTFSVSGTILYASLCSLYVVTNRDLCEFSVVASGLGESFAVNGSVPAPVGTGDHYLIFCALNEANGRMSGGVRVSFTAPPYQTRTNSVSEASSATPTATVSPEVRDDHNSDAETIWISVATVVTVLLLIIAGIAGVMMFRRRASRAATNETESGTLFGERDPPTPRGVNDANVTGNCLITGRNRLMASLADIHDVKYT
jgi:hypothetical protein